MRLLNEIFELLIGLVSLICTTIIALGRLTFRWLRNLWNNHKILIAEFSIYAIMTLSGLALVGYLIKDTFFKEYYDYHISSNVVERHFENNTTRLYNPSTKRYITESIGWLSEASNDSPTAVYSIPHKRGYINVESGEIIIDANTNNYTRAWIFSEGLAAVEKDGKIGFINENNEVVIPFQYDYNDEDCNMYGIGLLFHDGQSVMTNAEGKLGVIDRSGKWIVEAIYDEVWNLHKSGYRTVMLDGKYGIIDAAGSVVYPAEYRCIEQLSDGFELTKGGRSWKVDFEGNTLIPFMFDYSYNLYYPIGCDEYGDTTSALSDFATYEVMNRYGIMNRKTGEIITLAIYSNINMISENLFEVQKYDSYAYYIIDTDGNIVDNH